MDLQDKDGLSHRFRLLLGLANIQSESVAQEVARWRELSLRGMEMTSSLGILADVLTTQKDCDTARSLGKPG